MVPQSSPVAPTAATAAVYGSSGGFTTFVANAAGPILNTYLVGSGLGKDELVGTSAWFYFAVNVAKFPVYLALGMWSSGGPFITGEHSPSTPRCSPLCLSACSAAAGCCTSCRRRDS